MFIKNKKNVGKYFKTFDVYFKKKIKNVYKCLLQLWRQFKKKSVRCAVPEIKKSGA